MCKANWRLFCSEWKEWIRPVLILLYSLFAMIVVPLLIVNSVKDGFDRKGQLILIGGLFVLSAVPISVWHIVQHIIHFTKANLQKHIIRILWMVPIYAMNAWIGLLFPQHSFYVDSLRECYEAYVIYNFMRYLLNYLNSGMDLEATLEHKSQVKHIFPLCCMRPWEMGREFIHNCKQGVLQYTVVRPITTFVSVCCELGGVYGEGSFKGNVAFPYIIAVNNVSQFIAMYCLVLFYQATKVDLKPMKPIPKFLCIKAVVFFSFFQGVAITLLVYFGYIKNIFGSDEADNTGLAAKLQNFLICIEMFLAAVAHVYSFPHKPFHINLPHYRNQSWYSAFLTMLDITDVQEDVSEHIGVVSSSLSRRFRGRNSYQIPRGGFSSESQYLIGPSTSTQCYQSGINTDHPRSITNTNISEKGGYGSIENIEHIGKAQNYGINIAKKESKEYTPQYGAPTSGNYFQNRSLNQESSSSAKNDTNTSSKSDSISTYTGAGASSGMNIKKSDSSASDWLSTPTDDVMGIDVKGLENDRITFGKTNPKV